MFAPRFEALLTAQTKDQRRKRAMYQMNEMELWNQRRYELVHEAEIGRRARRPKRAVRFQNALFGRVLEATVRLRAADGGRA
jgi:hypothetical protein